MTIGGALRKPRATTRVVDQSSLANFAFRVHHPNLHMAAAVEKEKARRYAALLAPRPDNQLRIL